MDNSYISMLYPDAESQRRHDTGQYRANISREVLNQIEFDYILDLKNSTLSDFFTVNEDVIVYRQEVFGDMLKFPDLAKMLLKIIPVLGDIRELRRLGEDSGGTTLYSITEIELYTSVIEILYKGLIPLKNEIGSRAFKELTKKITELTESDYYKNLNAKLAELTSRVREIKSITVGVNLDAQLRPEHAGVLSINNEQFKSGEILDKILRLDFKEDNYTCIASLVPFRRGQSENQQMALSFAFNSAINEVFKSSMRSWKKIVQVYVLENTDFLLQMMPEIEFIVKATNLMHTLEERGCVLSRPKMAPMAQKCFFAKDLYNPVVAMKTDSEIVLNDFSFDDDGMIYVLTGPNRGGKSVITCAVGLSFAMAQLGMLVPAREMLISPADGIVTHFPTGSEDTIDKGRLGEECARLDVLFGQITEYSLALLDESLSSTGSFEGAYIAGEVLAGFSMAGCRCIFSTHLHELAAAVEDINQRCVSGGGVVIDNLVAAITEGQRSFKITRAKPDGKSYARDIAEKYGLSFDKIMKKIGQK